MRKIKAHKRYSYWVFVVVMACGALPEALPYLKDSVPPWVFALLAVLGIVAQHLKQEVTENGNEQQEQVPPNDP